MDTGFAVHYAFGEEQRVKNACLYLACRAARDSIEWLLELPPKRPSLVIEEIRRDLEDISEKLSAYHADVPAH